MMVQKMFVNRYGTYPCDDYLNNAIRYLLKEDASENVNLAISEICYAIQKAGGRFFDDVKEELIKRDLCKFV